MSERKRKLVTGKMPAFRVTKTEEDPENDLKKVKAKILKELEENQAKIDDWLDKEMDKNLKKP